MSVIEARGRITARAAQPIVDKLQQAADLTGATINQFLVQAALEKAEHIIARERSIRLDLEDAQMLMNLLENPVPNPALARALQRYQEKVNNGTLHSRAESGT
jgi:uncharacterized protein (DUF1778 family)